MTNTELKNNIDAAITNKTSALSITPVNVGEQIKSTVDYIDQEITNIELTPGPQGIQGVQGPTGPQGVAGPVGPAGLNWQGAWVSGTSYVEDDAVGHNGASWFCINPTSGTIPPNADTTNWALLASQGAQGPQGPQGIQGPAGGNVVKTRGSVFGGSYPNETILDYDINVLQSGGNNSFKLPDTNTIGKEIIVDVMGTTARIYGFVSGTVAFETTVNSSSSQCILAFNDLVKFTCIANNFWLVEYVLREEIIIPQEKIFRVMMELNGTNQPSFYRIFKDSLQINRDDPGNINYRRIYATRDDVGIYTFRIHFNPNGAGNIPDEYKLDFSTSDGRVTFQSYASNMHLNGLTTYFFILKTLDPTTGLPYDPTYLMTNMYLKLWD